MRILHIGKYYSPFRGGVETYLRDAMHALTERGHSCAALVHQHESIHESVIEFHGPEGQCPPGTETCPADCWEVLRSGTWATAFFTPISPNFRRDLDRLIAQFKPDIIHAHLPNPSACWLLGLKASRDIPLVIHWHSDVLTGEQGFMMNLLYAAYRPFEQRLLKKATAVIVTSQPYLESSEALRDFQDKCRVVPLGLDVRRILEPSVHQPSSDDKGLQILAVGRLTYYKGFAVLINAMARLPNAHLKMIGTGNQENELQELARGLGIQNRVEFLGGVDDQRLADELSACDCLCLPSIERTEAFGLVLLEAMAYGKAVVSSRLEGSGMSWVVVDGETGLQFPPKDAGALADALDRLEKEEGLKERLGRAGRARFDSIFSIESSAKGLEDVYRDVVMSSQTV